MNMTHPLLDSVRQDVSYALRGVRRSPGFAAAVTIVTSLGIGATTSVFGLLDALVLKPLPVRNPDRLVYLDRPSFSYPIFSGVRSSGGEIFSSLAAWNLESVHVDWNGELEPAEILTASGDFYSTLGVQAAVGRLLAEDDDRIGGGPDGLVAVISHACWVRRFAADPSVPGRTIRIDRQPFTIVGVTPRGFFGVAPGLAPEITIPLTTLHDPEELASPSSAWLHLLGRLRDGLTLRQADSAFQQVWPRVLESAMKDIMPADRRARYLARRSALMSAEAGYSRVRNQFADPLWLLLGLTALLFTVACASAGNLLLARGVARQRELAVRQAIGASRGRLIRQLLTESVVWISLGTLGGVLIASWTGGVLVAMMTTHEEPLVLEVASSGRMTLFAAGLTLLTVTICAVVPALLATRSRPGSALRDTGQAPRSLLRLWSPGKVLVAAQVALTMVLLVGAGLFVRSLASVLSRDAGFDRENVLVIGTDAQVAGYEEARLSAFYTQLRERLGAVPGVVSTSLSTYPPISDEDGQWTQSIAIDGAPLEPESSRLVYFNAISPGYFATVGMHLRAGRDFTEADTATAGKVVIVNESLARRFFPNQNPVGRRISIGRDERRQDLEIVGIAGDAKYQRLQESPRSIAYLPVAQQATGDNLFVELRSAGRAASVAAGVRQAIRALDPAVPVRIETVADRIRLSLVKERVLALLASTLGLAALVLACTALYGLLAYAVSRQAKEIGLRLALGANRPVVIWMVLRDCLFIAGIGTAAGAAGALLLARYTRTLLHGISPTDAVSLLGAGLVMLAVAVFAGWLPARRAAAVDPVVALKSE
jgi:putative ABC transport system permease protein